jgi:hypothetical protein
MARLDQKNRPQGTYLVGVGNTEMPTGGVVGKEMAHPKAPGAAASVSNSLTEHTQKAAHLAAIALGEKKADEMPTADLGAPTAPGAPGAQAAPGGVGALAKAKMLLDLLKSKFQGAQPSPEATVATAGLAEHPNGMEVMAMVLDRSKTASEAEDVLQQILAQQGQDGQLASPELVEALQALLAGQGGEGAPPAEGAAPPAPEGPPPGEGGEDVKSAGMRDLVGKLNPFSKSKGGAPETNAPPVETPNQPATNAKSASALVDILKRASDGSLTSVGKNTPESAAKDDQTAALDLKNRSAGQYVVSQGKSDMPNVGQVYEVKKPAPAKDNPVSTDTTPSRETKSASLSEEEAEYVSQLRKTAEVYGPKLPIAMPQEEKVAHIHKLHGLVPSERPAYLATILK